MKRVPIKRLLALVVALALLYAGIRWGIAPLAIRHYYNTIFKSAETLRIDELIHVHPSTGKPAPTRAITLSRKKDSEIFKQLEGTLDNAYLKPYKCQCAPMYRVTAFDRDGKELGVVIIMHYLDSDSQPFRGMHYFYPALHPGGDEYMIDVLMRHFEQMDAPEQ